MSALMHLAKWFFGLEAATTQTTIEERACLQRWASGRKRLAEIGVWEGVTTSQLRANLLDSSVYFAIDPYPKGLLGFSSQWIIAKSTVAKYPRGKVVWLRTTGVEAARDSRVQAAPIDFVFIDGDHSYDGLKGDWEAWSPLIALGGIVALHDSRSTPERPIDDAGSVIFTTELIKNLTAFRVAETVDSLTILERI